MVLPKFSKAVAAALMQQHHLKHREFGPKFQAYSEECLRDGKELNGIYMLGLISSQFDLDRDQGQLLTEQELLALPIHGTTLKDLKMFYERLLHISSMVPVSDLPDKKLLARWLYKRVIDVPAMRRYVEIWHDAKPGSKKKSYDYLLSRIRLVLLESNFDDNAAAVRTNLHKGPAPTEKQQNAKKPGMPGVGTKDGKHPPQEKDPPPTPDAKGKGKGKGKAKREKQKAKGATARIPVKDWTPAKKAQTACMFEVKAKGSCEAGKACAFSHDQPSQYLPRQRLHGKTGRKPCQEELQSSLEWRR